MRDNRIVFIGGGGHGKSVLDTALRMNIFQEIVITDYNMDQDSEIMGCKVVGNDSELASVFAKGIRQAFIAVGSIENTKMRHAIYEKAKEIGFVFPNIIDPSAIVSKTAVLGAGVFVGKNAVVNSFADIGDMAIINTGAIIEHECKIGSFTHVSVNAVICGRSAIGNDSFIGAGSTVIQCVDIGSNAVIGAGSIILKDVEAENNVHGVW